MNIAFYFTYLPSSGGVYTYAFSTLNALIMNENIESIMVIVSAENLPILSKTIIDKKIRFVVLKFNHWQKILLAISSLCFDIYDLKPSRTQFLRTVASFINPFNHLIDSLKVDLLHIPSLVSQGYGMKTPIVLTMHDFQELHFPEFFTPYQRLQRAILYKRSIENCNHLIVSFNHIKEDIIKYFKIPSNKISICFNSDVKLWFKGIKILDLSIIKIKYNLPDSFILYPSKTWPHKNHVGLIKALNILNKKNIKVNLVLTSAKTDYLENIFQVAKELNIQNSIFHLGLISNDELVCLYKLASATILPTLYEAGSGPLFEAMYFGCPVICSNVTSLPETIENEVFLFDPNNYNEMADKIEKILFDEEYRQLNLNNSKKRIEFFTKIDTSEEFFNSYKKAIKMN